MGNKQLIAEARSEEPTDWRSLAWHLADALEESERCGAELIRLRREHDVKRTEVEAKRDALAATLERVRGWADPNYAPGFTAENRLAEIADALDSAPPVAVNGFIDIVFDGPPDHVAPRFVEVEDESGASVNVGQWIDRGDGYWVLRLARVARPRPDRDVIYAAIRARLEWASLHWTVDTPEMHFAVADAVLSAIEPVPAGVEWEYGYSGTHASVCDSYIGDGTECDCEARVGKDRPDTRRTRGVAAGPWVAIEKGGE